jgi:hypothetical protein
LRRSPSRSTCNISVPCSTQPSRPAGEAAMRRCRTVRRQPAGSRIGSGSPGCRGEFSACAPRRQSCSSRHSPGGCRRASVSADHVGPPNTITGLFAPRQFEYGACQSASPSWRSSRRPRTSVPPPIPRTLPSHLQRSAQDGLHEPHRQFVPLRRGDRTDQEQHADPGRENRRDLMSWVLTLQDLGESRLSQEPARLRHARPLVVRSVERAHATLRTVQRGPVAHVFPLALRVSEPIADLDPHR